MKSVKDIETVYFIGIGGIGMSALARYFHSLGKQVSGYDKTPTPLTRELEKEGMEVHYEENLALIPKKPDLVVFTPAIPPAHTELKFYQDNGFEVLKRSEVLGIISYSSFNICIGGTHGKTTTTTMTAHILRHSGYGCNAFLGGISVNYNTNFWSDSHNVAVIEADEYDRSFLRLHPDIAAISSMDPDHLDIYGTEAAFQEAFVDFSKQLKTGGLLISKYGLPKSSELRADRHLVYSLQNNLADVYATDIIMDNGSYHFAVVINGEKIEGFTLHMGGLHNVENAVLSIAIAHQLSIETKKIIAAVEAFKGVKRRFEYLVKNKRVVYVDDYAHHPEELKALINGAKALFPDRKCTVIFQPHLYSRTNDLAKEFAESLDLADEVILLPIYPARELPMPGVESEIISAKMKSANVKIVPKSEAVKYINENFIPGINNETGFLLITAGAGDIDTLVEPLKEILAVA